MRFLQKAIIGGIKGYKDRMEFYALLSQSVFGGIKTCKSHMDYTSFDQKGIYRYQKPYRI